MNPMKAHPMTMDKMIFELNASIHATSLYLLICSQLDEGQRPTLALASRTWNSTEENLVLAARELLDLRILQSLDPNDFDMRLFLNPREKWSWCNARRNAACAANNGGSRPGIGAS